MINHNFIAMIMLLFAAFIQGYLIIQTNEKHITNLGDKIEQNETIEEHHFTCVGVSVGKSKCVTEWIGVQRKGMKECSCCVVQEVGE